MKPFRWSAEKDDQSRAERGISFEAITVAVDAGGLLDVLDHPNPERYGRQRLLVVASDGYVYLVPFVEEEEHLFLKTIIPSRKATRHYLREGESHDAS